MGTRLELINLAFAHLGESIVTTLEDDPPSPNVSKALAQLPQALDDVLSMRAWLCALETPLIAADTAPIGGWGDWKYAHRFTLPAATLRVWLVDEVADGDAWTRGVAIDDAGAVRHVVRATWAGPLKARVILRRPIEALTPLLFTGLSYLLASRLAGPIQSNADRGTGLKRDAMDMIERAEGLEASEQGGDDDWFGEGSLYAARMSAP